MRDSYQLKKLPLADPGLPGTHSPSESNFFYFLAVFGETIDQIIAFHVHLWSWRPRKIWNSQKPRALKQWPTKEPDKMEMTENECHVWHAIVPSDCHLNLTNYHRFPYFPKTRPADLSKICSRHCKRPHLYVSTSSTGSLSNYLIKDIYLISCMFLVQMACEHELTP